jgi:hypothetical protein
MHAAPTYAVQIQIALMPVGAPSDVVVLRGKFNVC